MNEWQVVGVLIALVGLVSAVAGPMIKLNGTISRLSTIIEHALKRLDRLEQDDTAIQVSSREARRRIYERMDKQDTVIAQQDKLLGNHEVRLTHLEKK